MNEDLLAEARQAQERLIEAEHHAEVARAEFHRAVRRLHLHGGSLREVAPALGLSHQRVHQIVESAGGSRRWSPRRVRRRRPPECTFCGRPEQETGPVIAGPGVYICAGCAVLASDALAPEGPASAGPLRAVPAGDVRERCSFCGKYRPHCTGLAATAPGADAGVDAAERGAICGECLMLCAEIFAERES